MEQSELAASFALRPQNFAWFLGAGASRSSGMPTATDILWDLKRRYYCQNEAQEISHQDTQSEAIRDRIQAYMESKGFPQQWADQEYPRYFEKIFGDDREKQRQYIKAVLSDEKARLTVGNRVFGALLAGGFCRTAFTTNFDTIVEKAVAEVGSTDLSAFHLECSSAANNALNNEEYPIYCKIHGDFRYDSIKNLPADLAAQNTNLAKCFLNASQRFGMIVAGFSGRDESVMRMFSDVLDAPNPFPHGLFWTELKSIQLNGAVEELINSARNKGVNAHHVPVETFDSLMLRLWRNIEGKSRPLDAKVQKSSAVVVHISLPSAGTNAPLIRMNALPVLSTPGKFLSLGLRTNPSWDELRQARNDTEGRLLLAKGSTVFGWAEKSLLEETFGKDLISIEAADTPPDLASPGNFQLKGLLEEALCMAAARNRPLISRTTRSGSYLIADAHSGDHDALGPLFTVVGKQFGTAAGLFTSITEEHPHPEKISWSEAVRVSLDVRGDKVWMLLDPDVWIWPARARRDATDFLDKRRGNRFNNVYNQLLDAWVKIIFSSAGPNSEVELSAFDTGSEEENPRFTIGTRTAYSRRGVS